MTPDEATMLALELRQAEIQRCRQLSYTDYLSTPWWSAVRDGALRRARGTCEFCQERAAQEVHHTTYKNLGHEHPGDLIALCRRCHEYITGNGLDRLSRRDLLNRKNEIMYSPEFQRPTKERLEY